MTWLFRNDIVSVIFLDLAYCWRILLVADLYQVSLKIPEAILVSDELKSMLWILTPFTVTCLKTAPPPLMTAVTITVVA